MNQSRIPDVASKASFFKNPLTMLGTLQRCWLFTFQTPVEEARMLIPAELELVTRRGHAFWNVVISELRQMRPWPLPAFTGIGYRHVAYRLYVRFHPVGAAPIAGLYFLRSDCSRRLMTVAGNLLTDFRFHTAQITLDERVDTLHLTVQSPDAPARVVLDKKWPSALPTYSAFDSLEEAASFLKYEPYGISVDAGGNVNAVQVVRDETAWQSELKRVISAEWAFFNGKNVRPEICYEVQPIKYRWNRGRIYAKTQ